VKLSLVRTKPDDGHEWPKHVVLILILKNIHPLYRTNCVIDYPSTYMKMDKLHHCTFQQRVLLSNRGWDDEACTWAGE